MIQRHFKARAARCLTVSAACSSFINAMEIVEGYFAMNKATKAIVVASEHNTEYSNETCPQSGHLWGDGSVAIAISTIPEGEKQPAYLIYSPADSDTSAKQIPPFTYAHSRGNGMPEGRDVFINACHYMIEGLNAVNNSQGIKLTDLKFIASHQANKRIMATVARQIDFPEDHMLSNIEEVGNTGCPSCAIALSQNLDRVDHGDLVALLRVRGWVLFAGSTLAIFISKYRIKKMNPNEHSFGFIFSLYAIKKIYLCTERNYHE